MNNMIQSIKKYGIEVWRFGLEEGFDKNISPLLNQ